MDEYSLIGRDGELAELGVLVGPGRLVTLVGQGGVGKTTLAQAFVSATRTGRPAFVDLSGVENPSGVESAFAAAMGLSSFDLVTASSVPDGAVVIVDNCEHVLDAAVAAIAQLRVMLPAASVLATSRVRLGVRDEVIVVVDPLVVPTRPPVDPNAPAVAMFRAVAARTGGGAAESDLAAVCELVRRVDGVPLAIEILATRTRSMSVAEILARLGDRLDTIGQGGFRRDPRQRSVRDTVEWSYRLLDESQRRLFDRLGVHAGRCSAGMAHALDGTSTFDETLDHLDALVAASLLIPTRAADGATWYRQPHAVRACALEHLTIAGELEDATENLVGHVSAAAHQLIADTVRGWTERTVATIADLLDGFLHAASWTIDHDEAPDRAFELMTVLWGHQTRTDDVLAVGRRALDRWPATDHPGWADVAATVATCQWIRRDFQDADALVERALPVADRGVFARVLLRRVRGQVRREQGRVGDALDWFGQAADEARQLGVVALAVDAELLRASMLAALGDRNGALQVTSMVRDLGAAGRIAELMTLMVESDVMLGIDPASAVELAERGHEMASGISYSAAAVSFLRTDAIGRALQRDLEGATRSLAEGMRVMAESGSMAPSGSILEAAAIIAHRTGRGDWAAFARAAAACPAVQLTSSAARLLPPSPDSAGEIDLAAALSMVERLVDQTAVGDLDASGIVPSDAVQTTAPSPSAHCWHRRGDHWEVVFEGRSVTVRDSKGMADLARLVERAGVEIAAVDLAGALVSSGDTGEVLDDAARRAYQARIRELQAELVEAEDHHDIGRAERIAVELDALVEHLSRAVGLGHRSRRAGGTSERARTAVTRRIRKSIAHLLDLHPPLGRHLDASIRTGTFCEYRPERPIDWFVRH